MQKISVTHRATFNYQDASAWSELKSYAIAQLNWEAFPYRPEVNFQMVHNGERLFIQFNVLEKHPVRSLCQHDQEPVYQDSCVEFFFLDNEGYYHNFEFNSRGVCLSAQGKERHHRQSRTASELAEIIRLPSGITRTAGAYQWSLIVGIPFAALGICRKHKYRANFYKCGDLCHAAHYLSWHQIKTSKPDFHRPEYFGEIEIE